MVEKSFNDVGSYILVGPRANNTHDELPKGFYSVVLDPDRGFSLKKEKPFNLPEKIYGGYQNYIDRILRTWRRRGGNTGALLTGVKGAGKTIMAKQLCNQIAEEVPVIILNSPFAGDGFSRFIESLGDVCVIIDEFEKIYLADKGDQNPLLTMFDGTMNTHNLYLLTCNDKYAIDKNFHGRPGRIYFNYEFGKLDRQTLLDVLNDHEGLSQEDRQSVINYYAFQEHFTFDILMTLIDELLNEDTSDFEALVGPLNIRNSGPLGGKMRFSIYHKKWKDVLIDERTSAMGSMEYLLKIYPGDIASNRWYPGEWDFVDAEEAKAHKSALRLVGKEEEEAERQKQRSEIYANLINMDVQTITFDDMTDIDHDTGEMCFEAGGWIVKAEPMMTSKMTMRKFFGR